MNESKNEEFIIEILSVLSFQQWSNNTGRCCLLGSGLTHYYTHYRSNNKGKTNQSAITSNTLYLKTAGVDKNPFVIALVDRYEMASLAPELLLSCALI